MLTLMIESLQGENEIVQLLSNKLKERRGREINERRALLKQVCVAQLSCVSIHGGIPP